MKIIGECSKQVQTAQGLSQKIVAHNAEITAIRVLLYEVGLQLPFEDAIRRIAQFLGVSADYLLALTDDPAPKGKEFNFVDFLPSDKKEASQVLRQLTQQLQDWAERLEKITKGDGDGKRSRMEPS